MPLWQGGAGPVLACEMLAMLALAPCHPEVCAHLLCLQP